MEITVWSGIPNLTGQFHVQTSPDQTVSSLLEQVFRENGLPPSSNYVLRNSENKQLRGSKTVGHYSVQNGDTLFLDVMDTSGSPSSYACSQWWLMAVLALLIGTAGIIAVSLIKVDREKQPEAYGIVFDAGSSHTKMFVYKWPGNKENGTGIVHQVSSCSKSSAISTFSTNPEAAGQSLQPCIDEATNQIADYNYKKTPVYLGATAGMRLLNETNQKNSSAIMASIRNKLSASPFMFKNKTRQARIISGQDEGLFSWITVNFLSNTFHTASYRLSSALASWIGLSSGSATKGALDLGGASTQFTFIPEDPSAIPPQDKLNTRLYGYSYDVYSHSYLCKGLNEARRRHLYNCLSVQSNHSLPVVDPCMPVNSSQVLPAADIYKPPCSQGIHALSEWGSEVPDIKAENITFIGSSNKTECEATVLKLFNFSKPCPHKPCSFDGVYQPPVYGNHLAFSGFYYPVAFLNLTTIRASGQFSLDEFESAISTFCNMSWSQVKDVSQETDDLNRLYCFEATYVHSLLVKGYGFDKSNWDTLLFKKNINNTEIGWSLGLMINASNMVPAEFPPQPFSLAVLALLIVLFIVFVLLSVGFACVARRSQLKKQQERYQKLTSYGAI